MCGIIRFGALGLALYFVNLPHDEILRLVTEDCRCCSLKKEIRLEDEVDE